MFVGWVLVSELKCCLKQKSLDRIIWYTELEPMTSNREARSGYHWPSNIIKQYRTINLVRKIRKIKIAFVAKLCWYFEVVNSVTRLGNFCTLGNFLKPLATINWPKSASFFGNFCKVVKINHFSSEIIFGQLL